LNSWATISFPRRTLPKELVGWFNLTFRQTPTVVNLFLNSNLSCTVSLIDLSVLMNEIVLGTLLYAVGKLCPPEIILQCFWYWNLSSALQQTSRFNGWHSCFVFGWPKRFTTQTDTVSWFFSVSQFKYWAICPKQDTTNSFRSLLNPQLTTIPHPVSDTKDGEMEPTKKFNQAYEDVKLSYNFNYSLIENIREKYFNHRMK
jgi:hypothetical protein